MALLYIFVVVVLINCTYYLLFSRFAFSRSKIPISDPFPVSVIVCAKNEAHNLTENIPRWLEQDYPDFELILINDASTDNTLEVMETFASTDDRIHTVNVEHNETFWGSKKYALTLGIKRAVNKRMLFTDADCKPASVHWIRHMVSQFSKEKQIVLGYGALTKQRGFLNKLFRYETAITAIQYFSSAMVGRAYMGVGRNLAYTSNLYYENKGFLSHMQLASGDDDLLVNEAATPYNVAICFTPESFTYSAPKRNLIDWVRQKRRHFSTARYYKTGDKYMLSIYYLANFAFWVLLVLTPILVDWKIPLAAGIFRLMIQYMFAGNAVKNLKEDNLIAWIPLLELFLVFLQLFIFISNFISKPGRWK